MRNIQWEENDLETIYVGAGQSLHYPMSQKQCSSSLYCGGVGVGCIGGQFGWWTVRRASNELSSVRRRSGPMEELSDPMDTAAGLATALQMIRNQNDRIEDRCNGSDQGQL